MLHLKKLILVLLYATVIIVIGFREDNSLLIDDIKHLEKNLHVALKHMQKEAKHEDVGICIGLTRSGKSPLINYLIGNKLIGEKVSLFKPVALKKADPNSSGPEIGIGSTSETMIPTRWVSKNFPTLSIWDAPGFDDNRGSVQDITNAFYIYQLLQNVKSLKIVLVVDFNDILNDNIRPFLMLLSSVENLLKKNIIHCFSSMALIFTKVPDSLNGNPIDFNFINDLLTEQILLSTAIHMSESSKNFVQFLVSNNQNIGLFKRAKVGPVTSAIEDGIFRAIQNTSQVDEHVLRQVYPSISEKSTIFLFETREKLSAMAAFEDLQNIVRDVLSKKLEAYENINNAGTLKNKVNTMYRQVITIRDEINKALVPTLSFSRKIEILQTIDPTIKKRVKEQNLLEKSNLMEFVDKLLDLKESNQFDLSLQGVLLSANTKLGELITDIQLKLGEISQQEFKEQLERERKKHEEERRKLDEQMKKVSQHNKKRINVFAEFFKAIGAGIGMALSKLFG